MESKASISDLERRIGQLVLKLPLLAAISRHAYPTSTLKDYLHETGDDPVFDESLAFLKDLLTLDTKGMVERWYPEREVRRFLDAASSHELAGI